MSDDPVPCRDATGHSLWPFLYVQTNKQTAANRWHGKKPQIHTAMLQYHIVNGATKDEYSRSVDAAGNQICPGNV